MTFSAPKSDIESARYEFRTFGRDLQRLADRLMACQSGAATTTADSRETYIVSRHTHAANVKFRSRRLDVKILRLVEDGLELWQPSLDVECPIEPTVARDSIFRPLGIEIETPRRRMLSRSDILDIASEHALLALPTVYKRRIRADLATGLGEFVNVRIGETNIQSVAVEAAEKDEVLKLVEWAGLATVQNVSYPKFLQGLAFE